MTRVRLITSMLVLASGSVARGQAGDTTTAPLFAAPATVDTVATPISRPQTRGAVVLALEPRSPLSAAPAAMPLFNSPRPPFQPADWDELRAHQRGAPNLAEDQLRRLSRYAGWGMGIGGGAGLVYGLTVDRASSALLLGMPALFDALAGGAIGMAGGSVVYLVRLARER